MTRPHALRWLSWLALGSIASLPVVDLVLQVGAQPEGAPRLTTAMRTAGLATGAFGNGLLVSVIVLGLRSPLLERTLGPLDRLTRIHHVLGVLAYIAILTHPLALAVAASAASWRTSARMLFGFDRLAIVLGWLALLSLVLVVCFSFVERVQHETWRRLHMLGWFAAATGVAHAIGVRGARAVDVFLAGTLLAAAASTLLSASHTARYRVEQARRLTGGILEVELAPLRGSIRFRPGQFAFVRFHDPRTGWKCREYHPFTIASGPADERLRLAIKDLGDCTRAIHDVKAGAMADVRGPFGGLFGESTSKRQVWLAGGVGITPFMSAARSIADGTPAIDLFYCTKRSPDAVYLPELEGIASEHPSLQVHHHVDEQDGLLTAERVLRETGGATDAEFFIAGPPAFLDALRAGLIAGHVAAGRIHSERFQHL